jgi:serine/threonine protein kinase
VPDPHSNFTHEASEAHSRESTAGFGNPQPGEVLGDYRLIKRLGQGAMGTVFHAVHLRLGRSVALKVIAPGRQFDTAAVARFLREMKAVGTLDHPHLVRATDARQDGTRLFLVMELIEGLDFKEVVERLGPLPVAEACAAVQQALFGIDYAHRHGVIHRDLKPSNLMLTTGGMVKVLDLSLARLCGEVGDPLEDELTASGAALGTPDFMAPEQCLDARGVLPAADVYSLGCTLYLFLTGEPPFRAMRTHFEKLQAHQQRALPPIEVHRANLPADLVGLMGRMTAKQPEARPTAAALIEELRPFAEGANLKGLFERAQTAMEETRPDCTSPSPQSSLSTAGVELDGVSVTESPLLNPSAALRLALIYKRGVEPDGTLVPWLESWFVERGHQVFVDRHLRIGVDWAREIETQVRRADVVIPLLSSASIASEMLTWEIQSAHDEAQQRGGKPRLLPVRVAYDGPLPPDLACILDRFNYFLWTGPHDNQRLADDLMGACQGPQSIGPPRPVPVGGLPLDCVSYIRRPTDDLVHAALARRDSIVLIRGARQMGKTSLLARGMHRARESGSQVIFTDFQKLNRSELQSLESLYQSLGTAIAEDLEFDANLTECWDKTRAPNTNFESFFRNVVFKRTTAPLVWALDEVDTLFSCPFGSEVFALFRSWHNARAARPGSPWCRLTLAIAYATEAQMFITNINQSPFNVGTLVALDDFTLEQIAELNRRYDFALRTDLELARFAALLGGHPYLVNRGLFEMAENKLRFAAFVEQVNREDGLFGDHLRRILVLLAADSELSEFLREMLRGERCSSARSFYRLRAAGVVTGESAADARPRCKLYADYLKKHLL